MKEKNSRELLREDVKRLERKATILCSIVMFLAVFTNRDVLEFLAVLLR